MIFLLLNVLDLMTTLAGGLHNETNPVGQFLIARWGFLGLVMGKVVLLVYYAGFTSLLGWVWRPGARAYNKLMIALMLTVVAWNIRFLLLRPG